MGPKGWAATHVHLSADLGRTRKKTGATLIHGGQQKAVLLPDGDIAFTYRSHSWQNPGVVISYGEERSFEYSLARPYETVDAFAHGEDEFLVFTSKSPGPIGRLASITGCRVGTSEDMTRPTAFNTCSGQFSQALVVHAFNKLVKKGKRLGNTSKIGLHRWLEMIPDHWELTGKQ